MAWISDFLERLFPVKERVGGDPTAIVVDIPAELYYKELAIYTASSIANVFLITAGTFAAMAVLGYVTKTDLSSLGKILMMALIGMIIATLVNVFFVKSSGFDLIISYVGVLIFVGLTAYDSQKIKNMLMTAEDAGEGYQKLALLGALTLYLDFINLFIYLLRILGKRE